MRMRKWQQHPTPRPKIGAEPSHSGMAADPRRGLRWGHAINQLATFNITCDLTLNLRLSFIYAIILICSLTIGMT